MPNFILIYNIYIIYKYILIESILRYPQSTNCQLSTEETVTKTQNACVQDILFVLYNRKALFTPPAQTLIIHTGYHTDLETVHQSITAFYWSSTPVGPINSEAYCLLFNVSYIKSGNSERPRALGLSVRPISH